MNQNKMSRHDKALANSYDWFKQGKCPWKKHQAIKLASTTLMIGHDMTKCTNLYLDSYHISFHSSKKLCLGVAALDYWQKKLHTGTEAYDYNTFKHFLTALKMSGPLDISTGPKCQSNTFQ